MTIPTTNVSFSSLQTEFGGTNPISLSEYYRGGAYVPTGTATSATDGTAISTSGPIRVGMFRGVSMAGTLRPSGNAIWTISDERFSGTAIASIVFSANGTTNGQGSGFFASWYSPSNATIGAQYWIRATKTAGFTGFPQGSPLGTWISLNTTPSWSVTWGGTGGRGCTLTFQISTNSAGTNIVATYTGNTLSATIIG